MGNYENLKQSITEVIRTNGNKEITGAVLQSTLLTIISTVGANATFAGIATPTTNPGTPDGSVFYLASESGTYSNFGSIELQDGLSVLMWNGSWSGQQIFGIDDVPTLGSDNLVKSKGVKLAIISLSQDINQTSKKILGIDNSISAESNRESGKYIAGWSSGTSSWYTGSAADYNAIAINSIAAYKGLILTCELETLYSGGQLIGASSNGSYLFNIGNSEVQDGFSRNGIEWKDGILTIFVDTLLSIYNVDDMDIHLTLGSAKMMTQDVEYYTKRIDDINDNLDDIKNALGYGDINKTFDASTKNVVVGGWNGSSWGFAALNGYSFNQLLNVSKYRGQTIRIPLATPASKGQFIGGSKGNTYYFNVANSEINENFNRIAGITYANGIVSIEVDTILTTFHISDIDFFITTENNGIYIIKDYNDVFPIKGKKWCIYGDSTFDNMGWTDIVAQKLALGQCYNRSVAGCGYVNGFVNQVGFYTDSRKDTDTNIKWGYVDSNGVGQLVGGGTFDPEDPTTFPEGGSLMDARQYSQQRINTIPTDSEIILIGGGINDFQFGNPVLGSYNDYADYPETYDFSKFDDAVLATISRIQERCPKATILIVGIAPYTRVWQIEGRAASYDGAIENSAKIKGIPFLSLLNNSNLNASNIAIYTDGVHPTFAPNGEIHGVEMYARTLGSFIRNNFI